MHVSTPVRDRFKPSPPVWEVYAQLCSAPLVRRRVVWQDHASMVRYLVRSRRPMRAALELHRLVAHHLFGSATAAGRAAALRDPAATLGLIARSDLPPAVLARQQAPGLATQHLAHLAPDVRGYVHLWVRRRAELFRQRFFEPRVSAGGRAPLGKRYVQAAGQDWYQRCLATMARTQVRALCQGDVSALLARDEPVAL